MGKLESKTGQVGVQEGNIRRSLQFGKPRQPLLPVLNLNGQVNFARETFPAMRFATLSPINH